jgi:hypothetical protein
MMETTPAPALVAAGAEPPPRFPASGADAERFGAAVARAPAPSRLVRVAEPRITWTFQDADLTVGGQVSRPGFEGTLATRAGNWTGALRIEPVFLLTSR